MSYQKCICQDILFVESKPWFYPFNRILIGEGNFCIPIELRYNVETKEYFLAAIDTLIKIDYCPFCGKKLN